MNSEERREQRYFSRKTKRDAKKQASIAPHDNFEQVFSYKNLYRAYQKCRRNVAWKSSTQKYVTQAPLMVKRTHDALMNGTWRSKGFSEFDIWERGKVRHIRSVTMEERVVQRCLCDNALVPALRGSFIYDNAASLERRGYHFALNRLCQHLREHYHKHGTNGYILLFDFRKFFDSIPHQLCKDILRKTFKDEKLLAIADYFIDCFEGDAGLGLGSQISQTLALAAGNKIDHYVKDTCGIRGYGRYMDDGYVISDSKEELFQILFGMMDICKELGLHLNEKKTRVVKISHGFRFLKARITMTETGRIVKRIPPTSVTRARQRLKRLAPMVKSGKIFLMDAFASFSSWMAYASNFKSYRTIIKMSKLFTSLFLEEVF